MTDGLRNEISRAAQVSPRVFGKVQTGAGARRDVAVGLFAFLACLLAQLLLVCFSLFHIDIV